MFVILVCVCAVAVNVNIDFNIATKYLKTNTYNFDEFIKNKAFVYSILLNLLFIMEITF